MRSASTGAQLVRPSGMRSTVAYEPVGPVAAFAPWNFPIGNPGPQARRADRGRLLGDPEGGRGDAGLGAGVLQCLLDAGLPKEVAQAVFGVPDEVSRHLLGSPIIRKLSFTGSTVVGKHLMKLAAEDCKRTTMELGGHGAGAGVRRCRRRAGARNHGGLASIRNAGQVCVSPTRFIVQEDVYRALPSSGFTSARKPVKVGDGLDEGTQMGPMANPRRPEAMERLIGDAVAGGAHAPHRRRAHRQPGLFLRPDRAVRGPARAPHIMNEEPFGPVALINPFSSEEEMIAEANRLPYGLAAYAWTNDVARQKRLAREVESGHVRHQHHMLGRRRLRPFGGVKWSGPRLRGRARRAVMACMVRSRPSTKGWESMSHELKTGGDRGYLRIATEEAFATREQIDCYLRMVKDGTRRQGHGVAVGLLRHQPVRARHLHPRAAARPRRAAHRRRWTRPGSTRRSSR